MTHTGSLTTSTWCPYESSKVLTNDFFVRLTDMSIPWQLSIKSQLSEDICLKAEQKLWTANTHMSLISGANSLLRVSSSVCSRRCSKIIRPRFRRCLEKIINLDPLDISRRSFGISRC
ncbi:MAG: hypothetical protein NZL93_05375 [Chthoniobacterales bacterium]|nr:hypothetical protein [Chthoniobacterales bacterium]